MTTLHIDYHTLDSEYIGELIIYEDDNLPISIPFSNAKEALELLDENMKKYKVKPEHVITSYTESGKWQDIKMIK